MSKQIILTQDYSTIVDDDLFDWLNQWKWYAKVDRKTVYAAREPAGKEILMHKLLLPCEPPLEIDHKDRNGLNNQLNNLRVATPTQNRVNSFYKNNTSGYKGVYKNTGRWEAQIRCGSKTLYIGRFDSPEEAARIYDKKAREIYGEFAALNFPD